MSDNSKNKDFEEEDINIPDDVLRQASKAAKGLLNALNEASGATAGAPNKRQSERGK